jgi:hypothetical protein
VTIGHGHSRNCGLNQTQRGLGIEPTLASAGIFAIAVVLVVLAAIALSFNLVRLSESRGWVEHTNEVLRNIAGAEGERHPLE